MFPGLRLLVVEEEFLIALDIQRIIADGVTPSVLARDFEEAEALGDRLLEFDLAIINPPRNADRDWLPVRGLVEAGVPIVVCTAAALVLAGTPLIGSEIVYKPFSDENMLAACRRALDRRGPR